MKSVLEQYSRHVKPAFDYYISPSMTHADIIVPRGGENEVAINLIVHHVQNQARGPCPELPDFLSINSQKVPKKAKIWILAVLIEPKL